MTGPLVGMAVVLLAMLMFAVIVAAVVIMALRLSSLHRTGTANGGLQEQRRHIVAQSSVIIGVAATLWLIFFVLDAWLNLIRGSPLLRLFMPPH